MLWHRIRSCALVSFVLLSVPSICAASVLAYELSGRIIVKGDGWKPVNTRGGSPAVSPSGDRVAFLREGNVFIVRKRDGRITQLTHSSAVDQSNMDSLLGLRVSWDPAGHYIAYTRPDWMRYDANRKCLRPTKVRSDRNAEVDVISTIWLVNVATGKSKMIIGPMGDLGKMVKTGQIVGASTYDPIFSPDGKSVWFANQGSVYSVSVGLSKLRTTGHGRLVARLGELDFYSPGASKSGEGVQDMAWDAKHQRLVYWIGRFWGSGWSYYGWIDWRDGRRGKATKWNPKFGPAIDGGVNTWRCRYDSGGSLWVYAYMGSLQHFIWTRADGGASLPLGAQNPSWQPGSSHKH